MEKAIHTRNWNVLRRTIVFLVLVFLDCPREASAQMFTRIDTGEIVKDLGNSQGASWADYDNDGNVDLFITNSSFYGENEANLLYRNMGDKTFRKVSSGVVANDIVKASGGCASWGDYDNDGYADLFTSEGSGSEESRLYHNEGNGTFTRMSQQDFALGGTSDGIWMDFDEDGYLDLIVARPAKDSTLCLFRNDGNGIFTKIDTGAIAITKGWTMSPSTADFNNDGHTDLFVTTAFSSGPTKNLGFFNHGNGYFTPMGDTGIVLSDTPWSTGASWGDYDNDGFMDVYVSNWEGINHLYHNNGDGSFSQLTIDPPEASTSGSVASIWGDFDNDGYLDLFVANDRNFPNKPEHSFRQNLLFHNNGDGTFARVVFGAIVEDGGHGSGAADYDNDGFLDIVIVNGSLGPPYVNYLYHNNGNTNSWINVKCVGTTSNKSGIGARVTAKATINGKSFWQMREIAQMAGCHSNNDSRVHFGLGTASVIDSLIVRWPSGTVDVHTNVSANEFYTAIEGASLTVAVEKTNPVLPGNFNLSQNYPNPFNPSTRIEFSIAKSSIVNLKIYNLLGQEIAMLVNEIKRAGSYSVNWDASSLPSGVYFYRLRARQTTGARPNAASGQRQAGNFTDTKKLILLR